MADYEIAKMLTLSTRHITQRTALRLDADKWGDHSRPVFFPKGEYGWFIWVNTDKAFDGDYPSDLKLLMHVARSLDCAWLVLDRDGEDHPDVPTYPWGD